MTVNEAVATAKVDALIARIQREDPRVIDRDLAFRLCVLRRWVMRAGGEDVEFRAPGPGGDEVGWMLSNRGQVVALEEAGRVG